MTELYQRLLVWHKLVAQVTGGLALCSARHKLNRAEALAWAEGLRDVSDEIRSVVAGTGFILDDRGHRVVGLDRQPDEVSQRGNAPDNNPALTRNRGTSSPRTLRKK